MQLEKVQEQKNSDGASSASGGSAWDFALTGSGDDMGAPGLAWGLGYGEKEVNSVRTDEHSTIFANYTAGMATFGYQMSEITSGASGGTDELTDAWGIAINVNDNLSISYGEREVEFDAPSATNVTEEGDGIAVAYTMGSIKVAGNHNAVSHNDGTSNSNDEMTEIAVSFAF